jgi:hypothetical protein
MMVEVKVLPNGNLLVPMRAEGDGWIGDGLVEIGPDHPDFQRWKAFLERTQRERE